MQRYECPKCGWDCVLEPLADNFEYHCNRCWSVMDPATTNGEIGMQGIPGTGDLPEPDRLNMFDAGPWEIDHETGEIYSLGGPDGEVVIGKLYGYDHPSGTLPEILQTGRVVSATPEAHELLVELQRWYAAGSAVPFKESMFDRNRTWKQALAAYFAKVNGVVSTEKRQQDIDGPESHEGRRAGY